MGVTFAVEEWFSGSTGEGLTVDMDPPVDTAVHSEPVSSYEVGPRLLVSAQPRWGGAPLDDAISW